MTPTPLVIDTDPGIDDALAILLALASPEVDLRLVTTVHGNVELAQTTENALRVLHLAGRSDVPVAAGARVVPGAPQPERAGHVHGTAGLGGVELPPSPAPVDPRPAVVAHGRAADQPSPEPVTVAAVGPLTNLALLLRRLPRRGGADRPAGGHGRLGRPRRQRDRGRRVQRLGRPGGRAGGARRRRCRRPRRARRHAADGARRGRRSPASPPPGRSARRPRRSCSSTSTTPAAPTAPPAWSCTTRWPSPRRSCRARSAPCAATSSSTPGSAPAGGRRWSTAGPCRRRRPRSRWPRPWTAPAAVEFLVSPARGLDLAPA